MNVITMSRMCRSKKEEKRRYARFPISPHHSCMHCVGGLGPHTYIPTWGWSSDSWVLATIIDCARSATTCELTLQCKCTSSTLHLCACKCTLKFGWFFQCITKKILNYHQMQPLISGMTISMKISYSGGDFWQALNLMNWLTVCISSLAFWMLGATHTHALRLSLLFYGALTRCL